MHCWNSADWQLEQCVLCERNVALHVNSGMEQAKQCQEATREGDLSNTTLRIHRIMVRRPHHQLPLRHQHARR